MWASPWRRIYSWKFFKANTYSTYSGPARTLSFLTVQRHLDRTVSPLHSFHLPFHPDIPLFMYFNVFTNVCPYEESVEDSHAAFLPEGLYFAMDILTGPLVSLFPKRSPISMTFLALVLGLFIVLVCFFPPSVFPHAFGQRGIHRLSYLDSVAQITSASLQISPIGSVQFEYKRPFNVCILPYLHP